MLQDWISSRGTLRIRTDMSRDVHTAAAHQITPELNVDFVENLGESEIRDWVRR